MRLSTAGLVVALGVTALGVAYAHHSFDAEYDSSKITTLSGVVTKVDWVNPHAFISFNMKDDSGSVKSFTMELGPPYALIRGGWKRDTVKIGDKVTVEGAALSKDGSNRGGSLQSTMMVLSTGEKLTMR
jgi:hypothetical protein